MDANDPLRYEVFATSNGQLQNSTRISGHDELEAACISAYSRVCHQSSSFSDTGLSRDIFILDWFCNARIFAPLAATRDGRLRFKQFMGFIRNAKGWKAWVRLEQSREAVRHQLQGKLHD